MALMTAYQPACVLGAAVELDVFGVLGQEALAAPELARRLHTDARGTAALLDALAALELLSKESGGYRLPQELAPVLTESSPQSFVPMLRHQMNCLRGWSELAQIVQQGRPAERRPSIQGAAADRAAFIQAMDNVSAPVAPELVARLQPLQFAHLLDVGGASGTWTLAFLRAVPGARATLFDLPDAIPHAARRMAQAGCSGRVTLVAGDFYADPLPAGADFAWVSAIAHQNSRAQNRALFAKVQAALVAGGRIVIRDMVMEPSRTAPRAGALFAINMLVHTPGGGTFTLAELDEDLRQAGFGPAKLWHADPGMNSVVQATKA
ncbi:MAG: methyltransferase [Planctomycetota bacterium]